MFVNSWATCSTHTCRSPLSGCIEVMLTADSHLYQVLTKRPALMDRFRQNLELLGPTGSRPHMVGHSVEAKSSVPRGSAQRIPARVRFDHANRYWDRCNFN